MWVPVKRREEKNVIRLAQVFETPAYVRFNGGVYVDACTLLGFSRHLCIDTYWNFIRKAGRSEKYTLKDQFIQPCSSARGRVNKFLYDGSFVRILSSHARV